jgi:putative aminopeptidase FrvX
MDIGVPIRYMHSAVECLSLRDVEHTIRLLARWILNRDPRADYRTP